MTMDTLQQLEYAIRQSIVVREDQDDPAAPELLTAAVQLGVLTAAQAQAAGEISKGDLLSQVQTQVRVQARQPATTDGRAPC